MATDQLTSPTRPAGAPPSLGARVRRFRIDERYLPVLGTVVVLVAMLVIGGSLYENFLTGRVMANVLINNSFLVVLAVGMTFVILTGGIDLSVGAVVALSGCVAAWMFTHGYGAAVAIPAVILVGTAHRAGRRRDGPRVRDPTVHRDPGRDVPGARACATSSRPSPSRSPTRRSSPSPAPGGAPTTGWSSRRAASSPWPSWSSPS